MPQTPQYLIKSVSSMRELTDDMFAGVYNPGQLGIIRQIVSTADATPDTDVAVFSDIRANYTITAGPNGAVIVAHTGGLLTDGTDTLYGIERLRFQDIETPTAPTDIKWNGVVPANNALPAQNAVIANLGTDFPGTTFSLVSGAGFTVSAAGVVTRTTAAMAANTTYTLTILATGGSGSVQEVFTIRTGTTGVDSITTTVNDDVIYGLGGNDTLNGGDKDDTIFGQDGNDTMNGGNGNDMLNGGAGADAMTGGAGDDTYVVDDTSNQGGIDQVIEAANGGTDTVMTALTYTLGNNVENLTLTGNNNVNGTGNALNNTITGNSGDNDFNGGAGNDTYVTSAVDGDDDEIADNNGTADKIVILTGGAALTSLSFVDDNTGTNNGNLDIGFNGNSLTVIDHFDNTNEQVEFINFDNGSFAGYLFGRTDYAINASDPANSGTPSARTVAVTAGNNLLVGETGANRLTGGTGNDLLFGAGGQDILDGGAGNDLIVGGQGNDTINGGAGDDTIAYVDGDGADTMNGGAGIDTLSILGDNGNDTLDVVWNGTVITSVEGGTISQIELIVADLLGGSNTLSYAGSTVALNLNLADLLAPGFESIANVQNLTGGNLADVLIGDDLENILIGGMGADQIDVGDPDDDVEDQVRFNATNEFGDTITDFDADGTPDMITFGGALNTAWDDGNSNDNFLWGQGNGGGGTVNVTVGQNNNQAEGLMLSGANNEGVSNASLLDATAVANAFNAEFNITAANGEDALLVINDTNGNSASMWQWIQAGGGEISAAELTFIGLINANTTLTTDSFDFV